jgi:predicted transposase/invertase (TIGR01784 family)
LYDEISRLEDALEEGFEKGSKEEREKAKQEKLQIAKNLLKSGVSIEVITKSTGLSRNEIQ